MKKLIFILLTVHYSLFTIHSIAQPCLPEGITFTTQEQIDNFQINYPGCTEIEGDVKIYGYEITNLDGLYSITSILGDLTIGAKYSSVTPNLENLSGLINLTSVGQDLIIGNNDHLTNLTGLDNLSSVGSDLMIMNNDNLSTLENLIQLNSLGSLMINGNDSLQNLNGLSGLTAINDGLYVEFTNLTNFTGLNNVTSIGGTFRIHFNPSLYNFEGLQSLISIGGDFNVGFCTDAMFWGNSSLYNFNGLENLSSIGGHLYITDNEELVNLSGLENLTSLGGELYIGAYWSDSIPKLTSIDALSNVSAESIENLYIGHNTSLSNCDIQSICDYLVGPNGTVNIEDNAPGCNNPEEVEEACAQSVDESLFFSNLSIHPNPFSNKTTIEFELKQPEIITITIYNHLGEKVKAVTEYKSVGHQKLEWNCEELPAGVYFCVLKTNPARAGQTIKMIKF